MKKFALAGCLVLVLAGLCLAQGIIVPQPITGGEKPVVYIDAQGNPTPPPAFCANVWNNSARSPWFFPMPKNFMMLDWGYLNPTIPSDTNLLPDELIEGFSFAYATNDVTPGGMTWAIHFYDQTTGWCERTRVEEANFTISGLPNSQGLPPGIWAWTFTVDLAGSGFEFLLDEGDEVAAPRDGVGIGLKRVSDTSTNAVAGPAIGMPPGKGNGPFGPNHTTQTDDAVCIYYPNGACTTEWFGGYAAGNPYAGMRNAIWGGCDPAANTSYLGIGQLNGNVAGLYVAGNWMIGGNAHFMLRLNQMPEQPSLVACTKTDVKYYGGSLDVTKIFPIPIPWRKNMTRDPVGDFAIYDWSNLKASVATKTVYFQGLITNKFNGGSTAPIDMSKDYVKTN